jgi:uncharacterized repeat protein (TIGR01451 family)
MNSKSTRGNYTMKYPKHRSLAAHLGFAGLAALLALSPGRGSAQEAQGGAADGGVLLVFPTGDRATGNLLVEVAGPAEVPVGRSYEYRIKATNITKALVLEDVAITQTRQEGFSIEKSEPALEDGDDGAARWSFGKLAPGESKMITVTAQADKEGVAAGCLRAEYQAALRLTTRFVKPDLKVTKSAPEAADLCDPLTFRYTVENTGSGAARGVKLRDDLPDGLTSDQGAKSLQFDVGDLEPGRSREFTARIQAARTGDYASRAVAEGANDLQARSNGPSTAVRQAKLAVSMTGPDSMYVNQPMTYRVEVTNEGGAAARAAQLRVEADRAAKLVRTSKSEPGSAEPRIDGNMLSWDLGTVEPGQTVAVSMTVVGRDEAELKHTATATSACERGGDFAEAATATETVQAQILTFPALLLSLVDQTDPVQVGQVEVYRVTVLNQGSGADENVKVVCTLPEQFSFVDAQGSEQSSADGRTVTLGPINRLAPHERAAWDLRVKSEKAGDVRLEAKLTSDYLSEDRPAISIEPTRIIGPGGPVAANAKDENADKAAEKSAGDGQSKSAEKSKPE